MSICWWCLIAKNRSWIWNVITMSIREKSLICILYDESVGVGLWTLKLEYWICCVYNVWCVIDLASQVYKKQICALLYHPHHPNKHLHLIVGVAQFLLTIQTEADSRMRITDVTLCGSDGLNGIPSCLTGWEITLHTRPFCSINTPKNKWDDGGMVGLEWLFHSFIKIKIP